MPAIRQVDPLAAPARYPSGPAGPRRRTATAAADDALRVMVILFKPSGKFYTEESWRVPVGAIGPYDMDRSPDFRRISGGAVLIATQEPWGCPHLFPGTLLALPSTNSTRGEPGLLSALADPTTMRATVAGEPPTGAGG